MTMTMATTHTHCRVDAVPIWSCHPRFSWVRWLSLRYFLFHFFTSWGSVSRTNNGSSHEQLPSKCMSNPANYHNRCRVASIFSVPRYLQRMHGFTAEDLAVACTAVDSIVWLGWTPLSPFEQPPNTSQVILWRVLKVTCLRKGYSQEKVRTAKVS